MGSPTHKSSFLSTVIALLVTGFGIGWLAGLSVSPVIAMIISSLLATAAAVITVLSGLEPSSSDPVDASKLRQFLGLNVNPWPIALLVIGIIGGSVLGISVRTNNWLSPKAPVAPTVLEEVNQWVDAGVADRSEVARRIFESRYGYRGWVVPDLQMEVQKWIDAGVPKDDVARRLFESTYPVEMTLGTVVSATQADRPAYQISALYNNATDACGRLSVYLSVVLPNDSEVVADFEREIRASPFVTLLDKIPEPDIRRQVLADFCKIIQPATK